MKVFQSAKLIDGFSACFRQWKATDTRCSYLHGYSISFKITFEGPLDYRNWVMDFGFMSRPSNAKIKQEGKEFSPKEWFSYMFDHTVIMAQDDPSLPLFEKLHHVNVLQLRVVEAVGAEKFADLVLTVINEFLYKETNDRVRAVSVECFEHAKNSATVIER